MSNLVNPPRRHHFVPEFHLKQWEDKSGKFFRHTREYRGKVHCKRVTASQVGWKLDLYRSPGVCDDEWQAQRLETDYFSGIDNAAAVAIEEMLQMGQRIDRTARWRSTWVLYLMSLFFRTPFHLQSTMAKTIKLLQEGKPEAQLVYAQMKKPGDPEFAEAWDELARPSDPEQAAFAFLPRLMANRQIEAALVEMPWYILDVSQSGHKLLLSDSPLVFRFIKQEFGHIAIPLSPTRLFLATEDLRLIEHVLRIGPEQIARISNAVVVGDAREFVISSDEHQSRFISNRFGNSLRGSLAAGFALPD